MFSYGLLREYVTTFICKPLQCVLHKALLQESYKRNFEPAWHQFDLTISHTDGNHNSHKRLFKFYSKLTL